MNWSVWSDDPTKGLGEVFVLGLFCEKSDEGIGEDLALLVSLLVSLFGRCNEAPCPDSVDPDSMSSR